MSTRYRFVLPATIGALSAMLVLWDIHNQRIIERMGMAWDMGAPVWPYQTAEILFLALNAPALVMAGPIIHYGRLFGTAAYIISYPAAVLWWYLVGVYFDYRLKRECRWKWLWTAVFTAGALFFTVGGVVISREAFAWWMLYGGGRAVQGLVFVRGIAPAAWAFAFSAALIRGTWRLWRVARP